jgi:hypothetical protein
MNGNTYVYIDDNYGHDSLLGYAWYIKAGVGKFGFVTIN